MIAAKERVEELRKQMSQENIDAYFIPGTDPHQSEYVPDCWLRRDWISGFTGSNGDVLITKNFAGLWTDSRYFLQAEDELNKEIFTLMKLGAIDFPSITEYLEKNLQAKQTLAVDPQLVSLQWLKSNQSSLEKKGIILKPLSDNLVDRLWENRPSIPTTTQITPLEEKFSGESHFSKLKRVRQKMQEDNIFAYALASLDSIAWLFNIRGTDIPFNPLVISYALITQEKAILYLSKEKCDPSLKQHLGNSIELKEYEEISKDLKTLSHKKVLVDPQSTSLWIKESLFESDIYEDRGPVILFKAIKNKVEQEGMRQSHIRDGVALCKFFHWLQNAVPTKKETEISAAEKLLAFRKEQNYFQGPSFETISGYKHHGAIVHYRVTPESNIPLNTEGIFLLDSGGQYLDGTTDVTRTIALGTPSSQEKEHFTRVLKGHITLDSVLFPEGTSGAQIDILARKALWDVGLDYGHGTGHGVGCFLNVHEGPQSISSKGHFPLKAGMVVSNEPGYYLTGQYGIRIENLVLIIQKEKYQGFLGFETLTMCPIDKNLIDTSFLIPQEIEWVNQYHKTVYEKISPFLAGEELAWLKEKTSPLNEQ